MYYRDRISQKRKKRKPINRTLLNAVVTGIFIGSIVLNIIFILIIVVLGSLVGKMGKPSDVTVKGYKKIYVETPSGVKNPPEIALISIRGLISENPSSDSIFEIQTEGMAKRVSDILKIVEKDRNVKGVIISINSPGGTVSASDFIYREILRFRESSNKPVVAFLDEIATSGGYYVASAADFIIARPTTLTGSIGVIMYSFNIKALMDRFGIEYVPVKSAEHKDLGSPFKPVDETEISMLQRIVRQMFDRFLNVIDEGRKNLSREDIEKIADGSIFLAEDALKYGLIDRIGYFDDAVDYVKRKLHATDVSIVTYRKSETLSRLLRIADIKLKGRETFRRPSPLAFYYIWERWFKINEGIEKDLIEKSLIPEY